MKWIIFILMFGMINLVTGLEDCQREIRLDDVPCFFISPLYNISCATVGIDIYNGTPTLLDTRIMDDFGNTGRCNITFNYTDESDYFFNLSTGDTGRINVNPEENFFYMYLTGIFLFLILVGMGFHYENIVFTMLAGFLSILIALALFNLGFPSFSQDSFIINGFSIVFAGIGLYLIIYAPLKELGAI